MFPRSASDRILSGVAGGLGARLGVEPAAVRLALVVLSLARGAGLVLYLILYLSSTKARAADAKPSSSRHFYALWFVVAGLLVVLREHGVWPGDFVMGPAAIAGFGSGLLWTGGLARRARPPAGPTRARVAIGAVLIIGGVATFLAANTPVETLRNVVFAVAATAAGLALIGGPWIDQLVRQLRAERTERIRTEERAEVAAHLHDSVLQTLALIQRASSSAEMTSLARVQERELRSWLYGRAVPGAPLRLSDALEAMAARIEKLHRVAVESVLVGDASLDERLRGLVDATGEAVTNAAKHAGVARVSVYCEVTDGEVRVYVRDEGTGFSLDGLPADRRGIAESIVGRMERNGGVAVVRSRETEGTEVTLVLPRA